MQKRMIHSRNDVAVIHTLAIAKNSTPSHLHKPQEINKKLAGAMRNDFVSDFKEMVSEQESSKFFHPRKMTKVLKEVEGMGVFDQLMGKKEMRELERPIRHAGKKPSDGYKRDLGGKPSAYKVTQELEKLKNVMEKPGATELLYQKMAASDIAYSLIKYHQLASLHAAKMDETAIPKLLGSIGKTFFPEELTEDDFPDPKATHQYLQSLDENQLNAIAEYGTKISLENLRYHRYFVSIFGVMQL
jgi:hypothetical protein